MVDGWDSGFGSDDEPPAAPPEEEDADEAVPVQETSLEPQVAPLEEDVPGDAPELCGEAHRLRCGRHLVDEVYSGCCPAGAEAAMDAVRSLHPHWSQVNADSEIGRWVRWVRCSNNWVYGELCTESFPLLLERSARDVADPLEAQRQETFVDLGCGTGKVLALASLHFARCLGLELQLELRDLAGDLAERFRERAASRGVAVGDVEVHRADFLGKMMPQWQSRQGDPWWSVADVAYACSPKFCEETMHGLSDCAAMMRSGSRFVTVRHALKNESVPVVWQGEAVFSWGRDQLIVHQRI